MTAPLFMAGHPVPTAADLAAWTELLTVAQLQVQRPRRDPRDLRRAANKAWEARIPSGDDGLRKAFLGLCLLAKRFEALTPLARLGEAAELARLVRLCAAALDNDAPAAPPPRLPYRED